MCKQDDVKNKLSPVSEKLNKIKIWWDKNTIIRHILQIGGLSCVIILILITFGVMLSMMFNSNIPFVGDIKQNGYKIAFSAGSYIVTAALAIKSMLNSRRVEQALLTANEKTRNVVITTHKDKEKKIKLAEYKTNRDNLVYFKDSCYLIDHNKCGLIWIITAQHLTTFLIRSLQKTVDFKVYNSFRLINYKLDQLREATDSKNVVLAAERFSDLLLEIDLLLSELDNTIEKELNIAIMCDGTSKPKEE